jgi:hypothetical protein
LNPAPRDREPLAVRLERWFPGARRDTSAPAICRARYDAPIWLCTVVPIIFVLVGVGTLIGAAVRQDAHDVIGGVVALLAGIYFFYSFSIDTAWRMWLLDDSIEWVSLAWHDTFPLEDLASLGAPRWRSQWVTFTLADGHALRVYNRDGAIRAFAAAVQERAPHVQLTFGLQWYKLPGRK